MSNCDKAIAIFQATRDGRTLYQTPEQVERYGRNGDGWQLAIVESAVNGSLNPQGERLFECLYEQVVAGDYAYPMREFVSRFMPQPT